jgi:beta-N-acetylhexosaminidase
MRRDNVSADLSALARSVVCVGFSGATAAQAPLAELRAFAPGGIVLFARNIGSRAELLELTAALRAIGEVPPLIAVDQEGGRVARISEPSAHALPAAMAIGAANDVAACERLGRLCGHDLAALGITVNFAPVGDLALDARNTVIGNRSYGDDPARVAAFASAFARGLESAGVAAAIKHFPGHGATHLDSHLTLPRTDVDATTLRARDLVPFADAIINRATSLVMSAHIVVTALDAERPATLSPRILTQLLRAECGFDGVVVTDCLEMDAIAEGVGTARAAALAIGAGADLVLVSHHLDRAAAAAAAIVAAVESGEIARARLEEAATRVRALRGELAQPAPPVDVEDTLPLEIARRAVTVVRGSHRLRAEKPVTVLSFEGTIADGAAETRTGSASLSAELRARRWKSELMRIPLEPDADDLDLLLAHLPALGDRNFVVVTRRAHLYPGQAAAVTRIVDALPDAFLVSAREPYDALHWPSARNVMCIYSDEALAFAGCADVLSGHATPQGLLPVSLAHGTTIVR